jgi:hypothetical protein
LHAERDFGDRATDDNSIAVFVSRKIANQCEEFAFLGAESLAFDSFVSEFTLITSHHSSIGLSLAHADSPFNA